MRNRPAGAPARPLVPASISPFRSRRLGPGAALLTASILAAAPPAAGQHADHAAGADTVPMEEHAMWSASLGGGWRVMGMAQAFPIVTVGAPGEEGSPLRETALYLTQPALMVNLEAPSSRLTLRTTLNFEGFIQEEGELTFGGWGEGFIDKRHPHTLLHELMLSLNAWDVLGGEASLSAGRGFAPYGTDDPMARPGLKYPTNHHLSQILERWTVNGVYLRGGWGVEAGVFGGNEPEDPWDVGNIDGFGKSWSARLSRRWGPGHGPTAAWEASASFGSVVEEHGGEEETTRLWNVALRHGLVHAFGDVYALVELSVSDPEHEEGYFSILGETQLELGRHQPYLRLEYATRPEYAREGPPGTDGFFRYDHDAESIGATRWAIANLGYNYVATRGMLSVRPFVNAQLHRVSLERGPESLRPEALFGARTFGSVSLGARLFFGGDPMRMGAYGVLDPMTAMTHAMRPAPMPMDGPAPAHRHREVP